jgi:hypothetical protein
MKTTNRYIDDAKTILKIESDRQFAKHLGWYTSTISNYRAGISTLNNEHAAQIADILQTNPLEVIGAAEAERAKTTEKKQYWANFVKKFAGAGAGMIVLAILALPQSKDASDSAMVATLAKTLEIAPLNALYIMSTQI